MATSIDGLIIFVSSKNQLNKFFTWNIKDQSLVVGDVIILTSYITSGLHPTLNHKIVAIFGIDSVQSLP